LSGDWGGARQRLADRGVDPFARYVAGVWSNLRGGFATGARYEGFAYWGVDADLANLAGWTGARFHISWTAYHGGQPSEDLIGQFPASAVSGLEAERSFRFLEIYLEQELVRGQVQVKVGQLIADRDFFVSDYSEVFRNANLGSFSVGRASPFAPFYPVAAPGAVVSARFGEKWRARFGVYTADPGLDESDNIGFDWGFDNGAFMLGDITTERRLFGLPASYTVGAVFATARDLLWESGRLVDENHGFYGMVDQALVLDSQDSAVLGAFARVIYVPRQDRSVQHWYVDFGLAWTGPLPGRDRDVVALALVHTTFSRDYLDATERAGRDLTDQQTTVELTYRAQITDWLRVQPSLQLFFDPHRSSSNAVTLGLQAVIDL
ncbi:MAG: carbohydrate porin, partial [Deltaproteobacteria bacterium]|nr:carbohydrate porin [Deltaproteobacteria bacterium]